MDITTVPIAVVMGKGRYVRSTVADHVNTDVMTPVV